MFVGLYFFHLLFDFLAIQYAVSIYEPQYRCTHHECPWSHYEEDTDFGFWTDNGERIASCTRCMELCDNDPSCGSVECGPDQDLPSGSVLSGYCSWWKAGKCEAAAEFTTNPANYILTCKKQGKIVQTIEDFSSLEMQLIYKN